VEQIVSVTSSLMQAFQSGLCTVESHKQYVHAHSHYSRIQRTQLLLQQMLQLAVFTLMEFHSLFTLMFHRITRITYTVQAAQRVLVNQVRL
jgi:hypothetical protein